MPTNTTTYSFQKPVVGADEDSWGGYLNSNWDKVDDLFDGTTAITGIDINSGTIDGTVIGGSSAAAITGTTITGTSFVSSGDMTFGDNDKAIFGDGSDLQILHDGSNSFISDVGTGDLRISASTNVDIRDNGGYKTFRGVSRGEAILYYDNNQKLATTDTGVDITGTLTSDGLTVGSSTLTESASDLIIDAADDLFLRANGQDAIRIFQDASSLQNIGFRNAAQTGSTFVVTGDGDISFYEDTGTTAKFFWDASAEELVLGSRSGFSSGSALLVIADNSANPTISLRAPDAGAANIYFGNETDWTKGAISYDFSSNSMRFSTSNVNERMRIDSSGNVGIGTTSPSSQLEVSGSAGPLLKVTSTASGTPTAFVYSSVNGADFGSLTNHPARFYVNNTERMRINSSGYVGIGTSSPTYNFELSNTSGDANLGITASASGLSQVLFTDGSIAGKVVYRHPTNSMEFTTNGAEAMRIDSSGNLLVGKTTTDNNTVGAELNANGSVVGCSDNVNPAMFNRKSSDGDIAVFRKDGTTVGSIVSKDGSNIIVGSNNCGLSFQTGTVRPRTMANGTSDGVNDLGTSDSRFKDLYLSGGVYLGGTGSANKLDDYEEGTWTPVAAGDSSSGTASYSLQSGTYTKIGNMVYIMGRLGWTGHTGSGNLIVNGLPFSSNNQYAFLGFSFRDYLTITAGKTAYAFVKPSAATVAFIEIGTGTSATAGVAMDTDVVDVSFSGFYTTNA